VGDKTSDEVTSVRLSTRDDSTLLSLKSRPGHLDFRKR